MKKIIFALALLPFIAFASGHSVSIDSVVVKNQTMSTSGSVTFTELENSLKVIIEGFKTLLEKTGEGAQSWSASTEMKPGEYTLTATISDKSVSQNFEVSADGGQPICMRTGECPFFGVLGGGNSEVSLKSGEGDCPAWFPYGCSK